MTTHTPERHFIDRVGWLRAAVLGANDGIVSTASLITGVASAGSDRWTIVLAGVAGLVAGAMSMAAGEYVSVSSQADTEQADLEREKFELATQPEYERRELARIYEGRGLKPELALEVADQLTKHDALGAHARDELGISHTVVSHPVQAAVSSAGAFTTGAMLPLMAAILTPLDWIGPVTVVATLVALAILGAISARTGGAPVGRAVARVAFWGAVAMAATAVVGYVFGVTVG
ncbi:MAG: VIT1/CCC1 transporter family protein [Brevirhabdus sp.]